MSLSFFIWYSCERICDVFMTINLLNMIVYLFIEENKRIRINITEPSLFATFLVSYILHIVDKSIVIDVNAFEHLIYDLFNLEIVYDVRPRLFLVVAVSQGLKETCNSIINFHDYLGNFNPIN